MTAVICAPVLTLPMKATATLFDFPSCAIHSRNAEMAISRPMMMMASQASARPSHTSMMSAATTISEFYPGYEVTIWLALFAPAGTPEPVLSRLRAAVAKALTAPEVKERLNAAGGLEPFASTPEEFAALIRRDYDKYGKIVKAIGIKLD
ncbi:MAG: hypothetical protein E6H55_19040 [Betaproteobacteria bacterium]|nr:MAG: hypothetical protein E6H55_19040 [Betaproteobacteria bacterium]